MSTVALSLGLMLLAVVMFAIAVQRENSRLRAAVRDLYHCISDGLDGCGPGHRDEDGNPYPPSSYITDPAAGALADDVVLFS